MKAKIKIILWNLLKVLALLLLNSVLIFFIVSKIIQFPVDFQNKVLEINLIDYWKWLGVWKWYYSLLMYGGILLGLFASFQLLKLFYTNHKEKKRDEKDDKFKKDLTKILGGK